MRVFRGLPPPALRGPCALAIGNFDGVHRGHQAMLARVRRAADTHGLIPTVMTFEPHPREFFARLHNRPELAPTRIAALRDELCALAQAGMRHVVVERFDSRLAGMPAQEFIDRLLVQGLHARWLLVGDDFRFGARRTGDIDLLRANAARGGFVVESLDSVTDHGQRISSSAIRAALAAGDLDRAAELLGRRYSVSGHVIHGQKLGRTLGFPTLNLRIPHRNPALSGIFVVQVQGLAARPLAGVASLGVRPTVDDSGRVLLEVHLLDFSGDAYGKLVQVEFLKKLRDEEKFVDLPTLTAAIDEDARQARAYFAASHLGQIDLATSATDRI
ncbi:bifunctional riboflavin kinase/FAD synthetase [Pigmentiphaga soli]|uniref:bifunctional riboflavin kinase/FAD synthetase n=1 Tax=Pigmentiphaga soli TaxID=1007095 RepID=UPI0031F05D6C